AASSSTAITQTVAKASSTTAVVSSANPSASGQNVTFTATISVTAPGMGTLTGTVQFQVDGSNAGSPVSVSTIGGVTTASFSTTTLTGGSHTVTAIYSGDANFSASSPAAVTQSVTKASTSTVVVSSANPSASGQNVT